MTSQAVADKAFNPDDLASDAARSSAPPYFHRQPDTVRYDFDQGLPDPDTYPRDVLLKLAAEAIDDPFALEYHAGMNYTDMSLGDAGLRREIAAYIDRRDGGTHDPDGLTVTHGSAHGVALVANGFLSPGDAVFVEAATFPFGLRYFEAAGAAIRPIPIDDDGMQVDRLPDEIGKARVEGLRPKMVYTIATHHLPTGSVMSLERRRTLLALAQEHDMMVLEDNIYREYGSGNQLPTLLSMDEEGRVLQTDSFAKNVAPAVRLGWIAGDPRAMVSIAKVRQDLGVSMWLQKIMQRYLAQGYHEQHIAEISKLYAAKRQVAVEALKEFCAPEITFSAPAGGWYFWLALDPAIDWEDVQQKCMDAGIAMRPGEMFLGQEGGVPHMRLAVGHVSHEMIREGMKALGEVVKSARRL